MERKTRIAMYVAPPIFGGVGSWARNYTRYLDHSRFTVDFIVQEELRPEIVREIEAAGGEVRRIPRLKFLPAFLVGAVRVFRAGRYDIVHANHNLLNVFILLAAWLARVPVRLSHSHSVSDRRDAKRHFAKLLLRPFSRLFATRFLACSQAAGEFQFGRRAFAAGRVTVVHNAIEVERFRFDADTRRELRERYGLEKRFVIGHIGRMGPPKNQSFLIEVLSDLVTRRPDAALMLVGDGPDRARLEALARARGLADRVVFVGHVFDSHRYYSAFDAFAFPSFYEGLGLVLVEAQANGCPALGSEGVPREAKVTDAVTYLPLEIRRWSEALAALAEAPARTASAPEIPRAYVLAEEVKTLESVYAE